MYCLYQVTNLHAQALDEQVETYNDLRRLKAMGEEYVILTNPRNAQSGINVTQNVYPTATAQSSAIRM